VLGSTFVRARKAERVSTHQSWSRAADTTKTSDDEFRVAEEPCIAHKEKQYSFGPICFSVSDCFVWIIYIIKYLITTF